ncbi:long-chain fatty acid transport protein [Neisseria sp. HSC-16F19]|nr:OmpP1/FadL family transporter [Neisseria sp. HSC-16F19]MCP2039913.1 long-chain fatty acid transport protein [Neisseria sp. HSC-16F19]
MNKNLLTTLKTSTLVIGGALMAQSALASGYHFGSQSVNAQSTANASTAEAADPSTVFHNPAGLTQLEGTQITVNVNVVAPSVKYENAEAYYPGMPGVQQPVSGATSGSIDPGITIVPHIYASHKLNDRVTLGVGTYVPFGSGTEYDHDSVLRYNLNKLGLQSMALQPTAAFKINDQHSVAAGLVLQHTKAELRQYANFGAALAAGGLPGQGNGTGDGYAKVKGDDWGVGVNLAWLWNINDQARMGVNYRSHIKHTLKGDAKWQLESSVFSHPMFGTPATNAVRANGYVAEEDASVKIVTPESLSVHGMYKLNPKWNVYGDLTWTRHSRFNRAELNYAHNKLVANPVNGATTTSDQTILNPNWRNTWRVAVGASYQVSDPLQLRFGWAYDQSPVKSSEYRMSTLPDANRMWFSVGGKYDFNQNHSLNLAYTYIHINKSRAQVNGWCGAAAMGPNAQACVSSRTNGSANYKAHSHLLGMQYTYKF